MSIHWYWIAGWFVTCFGLVGNSWVIFIITKRKRLQTTANLLILSLAVADLSVTCGYFPASFACNLKLFGTNSCNNFLRLNFTDFFMEASMFALLAVITERYIAIVYSLKYVCFMTTKRIVAIVAVSWGIPVLLFVARWMYKLYYSKLSAREELVIIICYTLLFEIAPPIVTLAFTLHILFIARKLSLRMSTLLIQVRFNQASNSVSIKAPKTVFKKHTVRLVTSLAAIFVACYGTEIYITLCQTFELCQVSVDDQTAFSLLLMANSVLNPLVYAFLKEDIKRETRTLLRCRERRCIKP